MFGKKQKVFWDCSPQTPTEGQIYGNTYKFDDPPHQSAFSSLDSIEQSRAGPLRANINIYKKGATIIHIYDIYILPHLLTMLLSTAPFPPPKLYYSIRPYYVHACMHMIGHVCIVLSRVFQYPCMYVSRVYITPL